MAENTKPDPTLEKILEARSCALRVVQFADVAAFHFYAKQPEARDMLLAQALDAADQMLAALDVTLRRGKAQRASIRRAAGVPRLKIDHEDIETRKREGRLSWRVLGAVYNMRPSVIRREHQRWLLRQQVGERRIPEVDPWVDRQMTRRRMRY